MKKTAVYILGAVMLMSVLCACRNEVSDAAPSLSPIPASPTLAPSVEDETGRPMESDFPNPDNNHDHNNNTNDNKTNDSDGMTLTPRPEDGMVQDEDGRIDSDDTGVTQSPRPGTVTAPNNTKNR